MFTKFIEILTKNHLQGGNRQVHALLLILGERVPPLIRILGCNPEVVSPLVSMLLWLFCYLHRFFGNLTVFLPFSKNFGPSKNVDSLKKCRQPYKGVVTSLFCKIFLRGISPFDNFKCHYLRLLGYYHILPLCWSKSTWLTDANLTLSGSHHLLS